MKFLIVFILFLAISAFLVACKSTKLNTTKEKEEMTSTQNTGLVIMSLSKSKSYGSIKAYNVKIYEDRTISYEGIKNVTNIGMFYSTITEEDYQLLLELFTALDFANLKSSYLTNARDVQKKTLAYSKKNVEYHNRAAPSELKYITKSIDGILEKLEWLKG